MTETIVCIGTGPSLTEEQIQTAREKGFRLFGCNNVFQIVPDLELLYGCNLGWWELYAAQASSHAAEKWTSNHEAADRYGLNWIEEANAPGLSEDPELIHHGHGSGYSLVNMALHKGAERILLLGYDLRYAPDYNGARRIIGSRPRHFFGEYPSAIQHWPKVRVTNGVHDELVEQYRTVADQGLVEVINCTPGSALDAFPVSDIADA